MSTAIQERAAAEVTNFERVCTLVSDPQDFTTRFKASMQTVGTELASAILAELARRERAA